MTANEIETRLHVLIRSERKITNEILQLILLAEDRKVYLERGFPTLFDWLTKTFGYSEGAAHRRIQAARLLRSAPEAAEKTAEGSLNLSTMAKVQTLVRAHEKMTKQKVSDGEKQEILARVESKTVRETEAVLLGIFPDLSAHLSQERRVVLPDSSKTRVTFDLSDEALRNLERVKELLSHVFPEGSLAEVVGYLAQEFLKRRDPLSLEKRKGLRKKSIAVPASAQSDFAAAKRRVMSATTRRLVFQRAQGRCEYRDRKTGVQCGSRFQIEIDHVFPKAWGGPDTEDNLRCLCRKHNSLMAERILGKKMAASWKTGR